ncbi:hypothetical protein AJ80_04849 [Polytolypa hystricis UAMH7299]|uniref:LysM domain-containing protein n=1 Tax=Polytolypa hystricis (strain UAMH7299) TaxID=1447883 RepID=A0A2B7Y8N5_POLH7|nr:hypothetical protein AJ80_04849 [Polytolypa hystricis UAMH7299]
MVRQLLAQALTVLAVQAAAVKRWNVNPNPQGNVDPGTVRGCTLWANSIVQGDRCEWIQDRAGISQYQFTTWNPSLRPDCSNMLPGYSYCIQVSTSYQGPSPISDEPGTGCLDYDTVRQGDTCNIIIERHRGLTLEEFYRWNPTVARDCGNLRIGSRVCVRGSNKPTPGPLQPGTWENCKDYYLIQADDTCLEIEGRYGISDEQFHTWNTGVNAECLNLLTEHHVCVEP